MTTDKDAKLIEAGRKLFAGDWQFIWASPSIETLPPMQGLEVAFAGRSNVGKSSLINALTGRNDLARTSHTPGRTQELIFFESPGKDGLRLVDMPGYGYASAPKTQVASWTALIHKFLQGRASLARVYVLIDARHGLKDVDLDVLKTLDRAAVSYQIVLTKADQVKPARARRLPRQGRGGARRNIPPRFPTCSRPPRAKATACRNCARPWCGCWRSAADGEAPSDPDRARRPDGRLWRRAGGGLCASGRRRAAWRCLIDAAVPCLRRAGRGRADRARHCCMRGSASWPRSASSLQPACSRAI